MEKEKKPVYKKWWFWVIIVIVALIVIGGMGESSENTTVVSQSQNATQTEKKSEQNTSKKVNVGEVTQTNEVKITYSSCKDYTGYNSYSAPKTGNKVVKAELEFENISNNDIVLSNFDCYADGEKCESYYYADDMKTPALESLSAGKKFKAILYFEVPKTATNTVLEYETNLWTNEKIEFVVK